jgi:hypothetical protein
MKITVDSVVRVFMDIYEIQTESDLFDLMSDDFGDTYRFITTTNAYRKPDDLSRVTFEDRVFMILARLLSFKTFILTYYEVPLTPHGEITPTLTFDILRGLGFRVQDYDQVATQYYHEARDDLYAMVYGGNSPSRGGLILHLLRAQTLDRLLVVTMEVKQPLVLTMKIVRVIVITTIINRMHQAHHEVLRVINDEYHIR